MRRIVLLLPFLMTGSFLIAQSPHGEELRLDCALCHTSDGWDVSLQQVRFDHNEGTNFLLEGTHNLVDCKSCHSSLVFSEAPNECISCHTDIHNQTVGNDCARCHTAETWLVDVIPELHEQNGFPLIGAHTNLSCVECHISETNLRFDRLGNECLNCHLDDYQATASPNHQQAGFSTDCLECHSPLSFEWDSEFFNHDFFPLVAGHDIADCAACHNIDDYSDISAECVDCHLPDYTASSNPGHQQLGLSNDCTQCHTTDPGWNPARFDIHDDFYPLNGAHALIAEDCFGCHQGDYNNTPTTCVGCHQDDFNNTEDPDHQAAAFSTDCVLCHNEDAWEPASFDHDGQYFPIYSGSHQGVWNACTDCHTNSSNFSQFSCVGCHIEPNTGNKHGGVSGYVHESNACFSCHPDGEG